MRIEDQSFTTSAAARWWHVILLAVVAIGGVLRLTLRASASLWEDEIIAVTHAVQPVQELIANVILHDIHPPLYFLQLHVWSWLGRSDLWLIANSAILSLLALGSLFVIMRRIADKDRALATVAVMAALPAALWMAEEVRMYAMLSVLLVWMFYFTHRAFSQGATSWRDAGAIFGLGCLITYTHAIGFVAVMFFGLYAASWLATRRAEPRLWMIGLGLFGAAGVLAVPMLIGGMAHRADMPPLSGISDVIRWMGGAVTGEGSKHVPWLREAGAVVYLIVVGVGVWVARTRRVTLCFLVMPMVLCLLAALAVRPLFKTNFFCNFFSPFLAIVIADLLVAVPLRRYLRSAVTVGVVMVLLVLAVANRVTLNAVDGYYRQAAEAINARKQAGDVVWVPQMAIFWGTAWYLVGPHWGSPLAVSSPLRAGSGWWKVYDRLGPDLVRDLRLIPVSQSVAMEDGTPVWTGFESQDQVVRAKRVWLVTFAPRDDIPAGMPGPRLGELQQVEKMALSEIQVSLYERK